MELKYYTVSVTPKEISWFNQPYTVQFVARTASDAIKKARQEYNDNASYKGDKATFKARVSTYK